MPPPIVSRVVRLPNPRLVKIHRNYTVEEVAKVLGVHKNTVREWLRRGLPALTDQRPLLVLGHELVRFLVDRRQANKRPCQAGQIYCVRCRAPRRPAGDTVDFQPKTPTSGALIGLCPCCETLMFRRVKTAGLAEVAGDLHVQHPNAADHHGALRS